MKGLFLTIAGVAAAVSLTVGLNSASASTHSTGAAQRVAVAGTGLGRILVDGRGRTLYLFAKDTPGRSACTCNAPPSAAADHIR